MDIVSSGGALFNGATGRWATEQLKKAILSGRALSASALRTLDTLRHEEWKYFDLALVEEAKIRLRGVADLITAGLVINVPNALGKTVFGYEKVTDMSPASVSLDGLNRSSDDVLEFLLSQLPLPITHKDFNINLRKLAASRETGEPLDTTNVRVAGRVVAEMSESLLFNGYSGNFGGLSLYGYRTEPNRNTGAFGTNGQWAAAAKTGENILADVVTMMTTLAGDRMYGPYWIYVPADVGPKLESDFKANVSQTIRQRLESIDNVAGVRVADQLPTQNVVMVQATRDVTAWVQGETLQTVQWDEYGGFQVNFKAFTIGVPLVRSDAAGRSGVYHMS